MFSDEAGRYRVEDGHWCIDLRLHTLRQLFDMRDPAPFRERDLDDDAVEYLFACLDELPARAPVRVVFFLEEPPDERSLADGALVEAVRTHLQYQRTRLSRQLRRHFAGAQIPLVLGALVLVTFLSLAQLTQAIGRPALREVLREGLVIAGWVALWRPIEALLFEWVPIVRARRQHDRLLRAEMVVRDGATYPNEAPGPRGER